jgi:type VI secretion system ImpM family protein
MSGVGFYGKLPGAGDFVKRRLPSDFVESWDGHFQRALESGRRELGEHWTNAWRQGAAWRFVLPPQVCGNGAWCGVCGPAADRLGRAFPMVLAAPWSGNVARILGDGAWFDALERVYLSGQDEAVSVETFDARVAALPPVSADVGEWPVRWQDLPWESGQWQLELPRGAAAGAVLGEAWRQLGLRAGPWCLWWTAGAARLLATRGLPRSQAALLVVSRAQVENIADLRFAAPASLDTPQTIHSDWLADEAPAPLLSDLDSLDFIRDSVGDSVRACASLPDPAHDTSAHAELHAEPRAALLCLDQGRTLVLSADDGPGDTSRRAAQSIRETVAASAHDTAGLRSALMSLHARLRDANHGASRAANENGAAVVVRFDGLHAHLLRVGAAALWHWRRGQLQTLFVERAAGAGGEFDDLLFGDAWLAMPGIGTAGEPDCDEAELWLEAGDRLLLLVTRELTQLPRDCLAQALALPTCDDTRAHLARHAGLRTVPAQWPLAVVEAGS